jgi:hypothetical protein
LVLKREKKNGYDMFGMVSIPVTSEVLNDKTKEGRRMLKIIDHIEMA